MKCAACQYDEEKVKEKEAFILANPEQFDKSYPRLKKYGSEAVPWIELEPLQQPVGIGGYRRFDVPVPIMHTVFACPRCGTLRIEVPGGV